MQRALEKKESEYEQLFHFIKNNKNLPTLIAKLTPENSQVQQLLSALKKLDFTDEIFSDADCHVYLLYLIQQEMISFAEGMTIYAYLMALMQFSDKQPLAHEDKEVQLIRPIAIDYLAHLDKLSQAGENYLFSVCDRFDKMGYKINKEKLKEFILKLPAIEQLILKIPYLNEEDNEKRKKLPDADRIARALRFNIPFLMVEDKNQNNVNLWIPSTTIINYILQEINPTPLKMLPMFGSISLKTLKNLHEESLHPVALYSHYVKSNPKKADSYRCGPFFMWLHDVGHTFWGSLLSLHEREFIFKQFIPKMELLKEEAAEHKDLEVVSYIDDIIKHSADFDLTDIQRYICKTDRLTLYLTNHMDLYNGSKVELVDIGTCKEDRLFFLINKMNYLKQFNNDYYPIWGAILSHIQMNTGPFHRRWEVVKALDLFAGFAANVTTKYFAEKQINWEAWHSILEQAKNPIELWKMIVSERFASELSTLTHVHQIALFPPYLPITPEKENKLQLLIKEKLAKKQENKHQESAYQPYPYFQFCSHDRSSFLMKTNIFDRNQFILKKSK